MRFPFSGTGKMWYKSQKNESECLCGGGEVIKRVSHYDENEDKDTEKSKSMKPKVGVMHREVARGAAGVWTDLSRLAHLLLKLSSYTVVLLDAQRK